MKKASVISIGNEVLSGQTLDGNRAYLGRRLLEAGVPVVSGYTVADDVDSIVRALRLACSDADVVLLTGGLGPTDDDVTRQGLAKFLGAELRLQSDLVVQIRDLFAKRNRHMPECNSTQAYIPASAKPLLNDLGTAPGILAETQGKLLFALPGVPREMERMFEKSVAPELQRFAGGQTVVIKKLKCFGAGESTIAEMLGPLMQRGRNPLINCTARQGVITLHIVATAAGQDAARQMAEKDDATLRQALGELVFGSGEQGLAEVVGRELAQQGKTLAVAESCTGGLVAKLLTDVPGASDYFTCGWVVYSNAAKTRELGVPSALIKSHGAVSREVAQAMAQGARRMAGTDFAIGITGIAGPTGATEDKPIGLVHISIDSEEACTARRYLFSEDRAWTRVRAAYTALNMLRLLLQV